MWNDHVIICQNLTPQNSTPKKHIESFKLRRKTHFPKFSIKLWLLFKKHKHFTKYVSLNKSYLFLWNLVLYKVCCLIQRMMYNKWIYNRVFSSKCCALQWTPCLEMRVMMTCLHPHLLLPSPRKLTGLQCVFYLYTNNHCYHCNLTFCVLKQLSSRCSKNKKK